MWNEFQGRVGIITKIWKDELQEVITSDWFPMLFSHSVLQRWWKMRKLHGKFLASKNRAMLFCHGGVDRINGQIIRVTGGHGTICIVCSLYHNLVPNGFPMKHEIFLEWTGEGLISLYCQHTFFDKRIDFKFYRQVLYIIIAFEQNLSTLGDQTYFFLQICLKFYIWS